jgi:uncharacterized protein (DUF302 family)
MEGDGLVTHASAHGVADTLGRLEVALAAKQLTLFARIDHAAGAAEVGLSLRPTTVLVFGNARGGTPLMQAQQTIGLDLPLKMLVWEDDAGACRITYLDPAWLARRHGVDSELKPVAAMSALLTDLAHSAGGA